MAMIITIDGPSGVGKSSLSKALARRLGFGQIDSGALYRAVTLHALRAGVDLADADALGRCVHEADVDLRPTESGDEVLLNGDVVTEELRDPEVSRRIANVADVRAVREHVNAIQRRVAQGRDLVLDGRDTGTVVFPDAPIKIYLTASAEERGRRRYQQMLKDRGAEAAEPLERVIADLEERDRRDKARPYGALRQADDAVRVDSTGSDFDQTLARLVQVVESHPAWRAYQEQMGRV